MRKNLAHIYWLSHGADLNCFLKCVPVNLIIKFFECNFHMPLVLIFWDDNPIASIGIWEQALKSGL